MSKRYNHYHIKVDFSISNKECAIGNVYAKYLNGKDNEDSFHFFSKSFTLIASRSKSYEHGIRHHHHIHTTETPTYFQVGHHGDTRQTILIDCYSKEITTHKYQQRSTH